MCSSQGLLRVLVVGLDVVAVAGASEEATLQTNTNFVLTMEKSPEAAVMKDKSSLVCSKPQCFTKTTRMKTLWALLIRFRVISVPLLWAGVMSTFKAHRFFSTCFFLYNKKKGKR